MKQKRTVLIILLALLLLLGGAYLLYTTLGGAVDTNQLSADAGPEQSGAAQSEAPQPVLAPDFTVYDGAGNEVRLSDYLGKPVVLNFWASWCGPCRMEMPHFQEKQLELEGEVQFLMVNVTT